MSIIPCYVACIPCGWSWAEEIIYGDEIVETNHIIPKVLFAGLPGMIATPFFIIRDIFRILFG